MRFALLLLLAACGGGGSTAVVPVTPIELRTDAPLFCGYYGSPETIRETKAFTNCQWIPPYGDTVALVELAAPQSVILMVPDMFLGGVFRPEAIEHMRTVLTSIDRKRVAALYPQDEPNNVSADELRRGNAALRVVSGDIPLKVIYAEGGPYPAIEDFDIVSVDAYSKGSGVIRIVDSLPLGPKQRSALTPGGANMNAGGRDDPAPFVAYCLAHPKCAAIDFFIWQDNAAPGVGLGIRSNGLAPAYCAAAQKVMPTATC